MDKEKFKNNITISKQNNIYKIEIHDYMSIHEYVETTNSSNEYDVLKSMAFSILWSNIDQKINKGTYYLINVNNRTYSILLKAEEIYINERTQKTIDDNEKLLITSTLKNYNNDFGEYISEDKYLKYYPKRNDCFYSNLKHDSHGSTYYTRYYNMNKKYSFGKLELTDQEAYDEINSLLCNLEEINELKEILDINLLKTNILSDIKAKNHTKILEKNNKE